MPRAGTAIGRAWLAGCDAETREAVINEIRVKTPDDAARYEADIRQAVKDCARQGFCTVDGDLVTGIQAAGVPYGRISSGELVVFNCAFQKPTPGGARGAHWLVKEVGPKLLQMVRTLRESRVA